MLPLQCMGRPHTTIISSWFPSRTCFMAIGKAKASWMERIIVVVMIMTREHCRYVGSNQGLEQAIASRGAVDTLHFGTFNSALIPSSHELWNGDVNECKAGEGSCAGMLAQPRDR